MLRLYIIWENKYRFNLLVVCLSMLRRYIIWENKYK